MIRSISLALIVVLFAACGGRTSDVQSPAPAAASVPGEPDYGVWQEILTAHYDPARGMDYGGLKKADAARLSALRTELSGVDVSSLNQQQQLAFLINLYNVNMVGIIVDRYPVDSVRDISTDPITRMNVFKKELVPLNGKMISLDEVEHQRIRKQFNDPRIHFAINCAARSCPPIRTEPFVGARLSDQLDDQVRQFAAGPGLAVQRSGSSVTLRTTKIMDWFADDFAPAGGAVPFLRKYMPPAKSQMLSGEVAVTYDDYSWDLNDWKR